MFGPRRRSNLSISSIAELSSLTQHAPPGVIEEEYDMASPRTPLFPTSSSHTSLAGMHSRTGSLAGLPILGAAVQRAAPRKSTILNCRNLSLVTFVVFVIVLAIHGINERARERVLKLTEASLQKWRGSSAASALCANVQPGQETAAAPTPQEKKPSRPASTARIGGVLDKQLKQQREKFQNQMVPLVPGFDTLSDSRNLVRNRFLIPVYACNEQETGSQMHVRQLLHLAKAIDRTLVLPNWGFGAPSVSICRPYSFDAIYEVQSANEAGLWNVPFQTWWDYTWRDERSYPVESRLAVIFPRGEVDRVGEIVADDDDQVLLDSCLDPEPFKFVDSAQYIATREDEKLYHLAKQLQPSYDVEALFVHFGFCGQLKKTPLSLDPLLQPRPTWGLWSGRAWPQFNYSESINDIVRRAQTKLPAKYAAMQWRMELKKPETLIKCADMFAETIIVEMRERKMDTIYVASDMPIDDSEAKSKSASFNPPEVAQAKASIDHLVFRLREASFTVLTWEKVRPDDMDMELSEGASGIFDRLMLGGAERLYAGNIHCAFKSSYLGSIQTLRQDRINDPKETDWEKLGMKWIGPPIKQKFWWPLLSDEELEAHPELAQQQPVGTDGDGEGGQEEDKQEENEEEEEEDEEDGDDEEEEEDEEGGQQEPHQERRRTRQRRRLRRA